MGENRNICKVLVTKPEGNRSLGKLDVGGRIILRLILEEEYWVV
jgi:hypothetical protein